MKRQGPTIGLAQHVALQLQERADRATVDAVVAEVGLPHPLVSETDTQISLIEEAAFVEEAANASGDLDFSFVAGAALASGTSLPGYIAANSRTLRDALTDAARVLPLVRPGLDFVLEELGNVATLRVTLSDPALARYPRHIETIYAGVIGQIRSFTARPFYPEALTFRHDRMPAGAGAHAAIGCAVGFGCEATEMLLGVPVLDRPIRTRNDALRALLVEHGELLEAHADRHGLSFAERVELHVQRCLPDAVPDAESVARDLGVSRRTLSRRLLEAETSFAAILAHVRLRIAARELRETDRQIGDIAWRLGYASQSAFSTAFRRATGLTPREFRNAAAGDAVTPLPGGLDAAKDDSGTAAGG